MNIYLIVFLSILGGSIYTTIITLVTLFTNMCKVYCSNPYALHEYHNWNWPCAIIFGTIFALMNPVMLIIRGFWKLVHLGGRR